MAKDVIKNWKRTARVWRQEARRLQSQHDRMVPGGFELGEKRRRLYLDPLMRRVEEARQLARVYACACRKKHSHTNRHGHGRIQGRA